MQWLLHIHEIPAIVVLTDFGARSDGTGTVDGLKGFAAQPVPVAL
jgi:hypothetical protein